VNSLVAGSARRRLVLITTLFHEARPRLLGWWNDLFACSPVFVVFVLLAGISLNATTVVYVSLKSNPRSNLAKSGAIVRQRELNIVYQSGKARWPHG